MKNSYSASKPVRANLPNEPMKFKEDTNPFHKFTDEKECPSFYSETKSGKRPRITKPVYSVRLS